MLTQEQIADLEAKHGDVAKVTFTDSKGAREIFVFRQPSRGQYKMWRAAMRKEDPEAIERLIIGMCVSHSHDDFTTYLEVPGHAAAADVIALKLDVWITGQAEQVGKD